MISQLIRQLSLHMESFCACPYTWDRLSAVETFFLGAQVGRSSEGKWIAHSRETLRSACTGRLLSSCEKVHPQRLIVSSQLYIRQGKRNNVFKVQGLSQWTKIEPLINVTCEILTLPNWPMMSDSLAFKSDFSLYTVSLSLSLEWPFLADHTIFPSTVNSFKSWIRNYLLQTHGLQESSLSWDLMGHYYSSCAWFVSPSYPLLNLWKKSSFTSTQRSCKWPLQSFSSSIAAIIRAKASENSSSWVSTPQFALDTFLRLYTIHPSIRMRTEARRVYNNKRIALAPKSMLVFMLWI